MAAKIREDEATNLLHKLGSLCERLTTLNVSGDNAERDAALHLLDDIFSVLDDEDEGESSECLPSPFEATADLISFLVMCCGHTSLVSSALWVLVRLCRRKLDKRTASAANLALLGPDQCVAILNTIDRELLHDPTDGHAIALPLCYLIMVLASDNEENQQAMVQRSKAQEVVATCLAQHAPTHSSVAEMALRAARNLAASDDNAAPLLRAGVCHMIVQTLERYRGLIDFTTSSGNGAIPQNRRATNDSSVQLVLDCALWAVVNAICDDETSLDFIKSGGVAITCGVVDDILDARERGLWSTSPDAEGVIHAALWVVRNLSSEPARADSLDEPLLLLTLRILRLHNAQPFLSSSKVAEAALWCLANFAGGEKTRKILHSMRAEDLVCGCVLVVHSTAAANEFSGGVGVGVGEGEWESRRNARHAWTGPVAEAGLWCIRNLAAAGTEERKRMAGLAAGTGAVGASDCCSVCLLILAEYRHRDGMVTLCCEAMLCLIAGDDDDEKETAAAKESEEGNAAKIKGPTPPSVATLARLASLPLPPLAFSDHISNSTSSSDVGSKCFLFSALVSCLDFHRRECDRLNSLTTHSILPPMIDDNDMQAPVLKLLLAIVKYTTLLDEEPTREGSGWASLEIGQAIASTIDINANNGTDPLSVITSSMERHPVDAMVARLGCELIAAIHYRIYSSPTDPGGVDVDLQGKAASDSSCSLGAVRGRVPLLALRDAEDSTVAKLIARGLIVNDCPQMGGESMAAVLHAWLPERYAKMSESETGDESA